MVPEILAVLRRNIDSYFIDRMKITDVEDVERLLEVCKKLDVSKYLASIPYHVLRFDVLIY